MYWSLYSVAMILIIYIARFKTLGFFLYLFLLFLVTDLIGAIINRCSDRIKKGWKLVFREGLLVIIVTCIICTYGYINAKQIRVTNYGIHLKEEMTDQESLRIFMVSDLHIGMSVKKQELDKLLKMVQNTKPSIVILGGDIYDEFTPDELMEYSYEIFSQMEVPLGIYYVVGNHEINRYNEITEELTKSGVRVLMDQSVLVADSFYLVGRMDKSIESTGQKRKSIDELMEQVDQAYPVILIDHQPIDYVINEKAGIDLMLSGHTHAGQVFPISIFSSMANEMNYGYRRVGNMQAIVTSGMGTWGFPMRVGTSAEMVMIKLK